MLIIPLSVEIVQHKELVAEPVGEGGRAGGRMGRLLCGEGQPEVDSYAAADTEELSDKLATRNMERSWPNVQRLGCDCEERVAGSVVRE